MNLDTEDDFINRDNCDDSHSNPGMYRNSSVHSSLPDPVPHARGSRLRSSLAMSPAVRGLAIVPRRISMIERSDSGEMHALRRLFLASRPPYEILHELEGAVEEEFMFAPKLVAEHCTKGDYPEIEILLLRRARKLIDRLRRVSSGIPDSPSTVKVQPSLFSRISARLTCGKSSESLSDATGVERENTRGFSQIISSADFSAWLAEFLFVLWYSSLPAEQEESISSIRRACKQIACRAVLPRGQGELNQRKWYSGILKVFPWRFRLLFGESGPYGETSWSDLQYEPFERDKVKTFLASTHKEPLHWLTREFSDPGLEKTFQVDRAGRLMKTPYWPFFLTVVLAVSYVCVQYGLLRQEYPSVTLVRLFMTDPISLLIVSAIVQLVFHTVLFSDSETYRDNFFFIQFLFSLATCFGTALWMYEVRNVFLFVVWPIDEGFHMAAVLICVSCLFYVRFVYMVWLTLLTTVFTMCMRLALHVSNEVISAIPLQQVFAIITALCLVWSGRYIFETHTRVDFILTRSLFQEAERTDKLLRNILPDQVIQHLKDVDQPLADGSRNRAGSQTEDAPVVGIAEAYDQVTILFADVCGFTTYSSHIGPEDLVLFLNQLFTLFDDIAEQTGLEKIKTIGDAYMAVAGLDHDRSTAHALGAARMGLRIVELMASGKFKDHEGKPLAARVGIHTGSCVAGVIGWKKFIYDIWGDAVNTASRMESTGEANMVHCSEETANLLAGRFNLVPRGEIEVKGKGTMNTFFVTAENSID